MGLIIPDAIERKSENRFPYLAAIDVASKRMGRIHVAERTARAEQIYKILELLSLEKRLNRRNLFGNIAALDCGSAAPEAAIFTALQSKEIFLAENFESIESNTRRHPNLHILDRNPIDALAGLKPKSLNLITLFNEFAFKDELRIPEKTRQLMLEICRTLKNGGQLIMTGDQSIIPFFQRLEKGLSVDTLSDIGLHPVVPPSQHGRQKPMYGRAWIFTHLLAENALKFSFSDADRVDGALDTAVFVAEKISNYTNLRIPHGKLAK